MLATRFLAPEPIVRPAEGFYVSEVASPRRLPVFTFLPQGFEPAYAYPLLVFFHGRGGNERQLVRLAPRVSRRNHICIGLRGPVKMASSRKGRRAFGWGTDSEAEAYAEEYLFRALEHVQDTFNIHPQRIFLAGFCEGATHAYRLGLAFPDRFAGVVALNGVLPQPGPLWRYPEVRSLRVMIGHGIANSVVPLSEAKRDYRLLYGAGLPVEMNTYMTNHRIDRSMLRDVNRWIMQTVQ